MTLKYLLIGLFLFFLLQLNLAQNIPTNKNKFDNLNLFWNVSLFDNTFKGANLPFGFIQFSPFFIPNKTPRTKTFNPVKHCFNGFRHFTWLNEKQEIIPELLVLPFIDTSHLSKNDCFNITTKNIKAKPGFIKVKLDSFISASFTVFENIALQKYIFSKPKSVWLQWIFSNHYLENENIVLKLKSNRIYGSKQVFENQDLKTLYFTIHFSLPMVNKSLNNNNQILNLNFSNADSILTYTSLSFISLGDAEEKLDNFLKNKNFNFAVENAKQLWEAEFSKFDLSFTNANYERLFLSSLYQNLSSVQQLFSTIKYTTLNDSSKFSEDSIISHSEKQHIYLPKYNDNTSPLNFNFINLFYNTKSSDLVNNLLFSFPKSFNKIKDFNLYEKKWQHNTNLVLDPILNNNELFKNTDISFLLTSTNRLLSPIYMDYLKFGFIPANIYSTSISNTLDFYYYDWSKAQYMIKTNNREEYLIYLKQALNYKTIFNNDSFLFNPKKSNKNFLTNKEIDSFNNYTSINNNENYIQESFFVPYDINGLVTLYKTKTTFINKLNEFFTDNKIDTPIADFNYVNFSLSNPHCLHIPYLFSILNYSNLAKYYLKKIIDSFYNYNLLAKYVNDKNGQISSWQIWTLLGLYPIYPIDGNYYFGYPFIQSAKIRLDNNRQLKIEVIKIPNSEKNGIQAVYFNNQKLRFNFIKYQDLISGGVLRFEVN